MAYSVPQFNLLANIWDCRFPADGAADWDDVPCQKYIRSRMSLDVGPQVEAGWWQNWTPPIQLRFPRNHVAFIDPPAMWTHLSFEVPAGSGQFYRCQWQEVQHQGFPNEYAIILVTPCDDTGLAIPPPSADTPVGAANDACVSPPPPPDVEELVQCNFWIVGDNTTGAVGVCGAMQDEVNCYTACYDLGSSEFRITKVVAGVESSLDFMIPAAAPSVDSFVFVQLTIVGDSITGHFLHDNDEATITATDSTFVAPGPIASFFAHFQQANTFNAYLDLVNTMQDNMVDTPAVNLTAHTMDVGSGWYYGSTGSDYVFTAGGITVEDATFGWANFWSGALTDYP